MATDASISREERGALLKEQPPPREGMMRNQLQQMTLIKLAALQTPTDKTRRLSNGER
jgi:hypothetical protein